MATNTLTAVLLLAVVTAPATSAGVAQLTPQRAPAHPTVKPAAAATAKGWPCTNLLERSDYLTGVGGFPSPLDAVHGQEIVDRDNTLVVRPEFGGADAHVDVIRPDGRKVVTYELGKFHSGWLVTGAVGCLQDVRANPAWRDTGMPLERDAHRHH